MAVVCTLTAASLYPLLRNPIRAPWLWAPTGAHNEPPFSLDLTQPDETKRWYMGPGVTNTIPNAGGLLAEGIGDGFHVSRRISIAAGFLGTVVLRTRSPRAPIRVTPYIRDKAKPEYAAVAEVDPADPLRQVAHFRAGRWDRLPVEGIRIQPDASDSSLDLVHLEITSEKWKPIALGAPGDVDWGHAFSGPRDLHNVVLIMLDTLRSDRMSLYGYTRKTTPGLERLAEHGIVFETARSQAACTFPSVNSLLTSRPAADFLRQPPIEWAPLDRYRPIAKILQLRGFQTFAVSSSWVVRATESPHNNWGGGYDAGFDAFDESCATLPADCVSRKGIDFIDSIDSTDTPWFLYLHYMDAHDPYQPPPASHQRAFAKPYAGREAFQRGDPNPIMRAIYRDQTPHGASERDLEHLSDLYDEEVLYLDGRLMLLFTALEERNLLASTLVVLVSDHGEEFLEHESIKHCRRLYETEIRVPMVFWIPGEQGGRRIAHAAQNIDVVPTILDYIGADSELAGLAGRSLRAAIETDQAVNPNTFSEQGSFQAVSDGRYKLILDREDDRIQLFDLELDRGELHDLAGEKPAVEARLRKALNAWESTSGPEALRQSQQTEENLRALGYID